MYTLSLSRITLYDRIIHIYFGKDALFSEFVYNFTGLNESRNPAFRLQIHRCFIQQKLLYSDIKDALLIMPRDNVILDYNNLFERIADSVQRVCFLNALFFLRDHSLLESSPDFLATLVLFRVRTSSGSNKKSLPKGKDFLLDGE